MGGLTPPLDCPDRCRRSDPHDRPTGAIGFLPRGPCGLPLPEGLVSFPKRLLLRDANVLEEVVVGAFGDFAECASLLRACNPLSDRRGQACNQAVEPWSSTNRVVRCKGLVGRQARRDQYNAQQRSVRDWREHGEDSDFRVEPDGGPTKRSRINRNGYRRSANHRFLGLPEFCS